MEFLWPSQGEAILHAAAVYIVYHFPDNPVCWIGYFFGRQDTVTCSWWDDPGFCAMPRVTFLDDRGGHDQCQGPSAKGLKKRSIMLLKYVYFPDELYQPWNYFLGSKLCLAFRNRTLATYSSRIMYFKAETAKKRFGSDSVDSLERFFQFSRRLQMWRSRMYHRFVAAQLKIWKPTPLKMKAFRTLNSWCDFRYIKYSHS